MHMKIVIWDFHYRSQAIRDTSKRPCRKDMHANFPSYSLGFNVRGKTKTALQVARMTYNTCSAGTVKRENSVRITERLHFFTLQNRTLMPTFILHVTAK
jgi:hypothetical protein